MTSTDLDYKPLLLVPLLMLAALPLIGSGSTWLTLTVAGLAMGMIIFIIASGLTLVFGLMDVLNFGHGVFIALGAFVATSVLGGMADYTQSANLWRNLMAVLPAMVLAFLLYGFGVWDLGPVLVLYFAALMAMGWAVALAVTALILRHGAGAEALAWGVMFGIAPFAAVFYPVAILPGWLQPVALAIPAAHVFEGMRAALIGGVIAWDHLAWAVLLDVVWMAVAAWIFLAQFHAARVRGALLNIGE